MKLFLFGLSSLQASSGSLLLPRGQALPLDRTIDFFTRTEDLATEYPHSRPTPAEALFADCELQVSSAQVTKGEEIGYPPELLNPLRAFFGCACFLLDRILTREEKAQYDIRLGFVESATMQAFPLDLPSQEQAWNPMIPPTSFGHGHTGVIALSFGFISQIKTVDELAYVLAHQVELLAYGESKPRNRPVNPCEESQLFMHALQCKGVETSVRARLRGGDLNPDAGSDLLKRIKTENHSYALNARLTVIEQLRLSECRGSAAIDVDRSGEALTIGISLEEPVQEAFRSHMSDAVERLMEQPFETDAVYRVILSGQNPIDCDEKKLSLAFAHFFDERWRALCVVLPPDCKKEDKIDMTLRLVRKLHESMEASRARVLGDEWVPDYPWQVEAVMSLRDRWVYGESIPPLVNSLKRRASVQAELEALDTTHEDYESIRERLEECEETVRLAKLLFEPGDALDQFVDKGYQQFEEATNPDFLGYNDLVTNFNHLDRCALRLRHVHEAFEVWYAFSEERLQTAYDYILKAKSIALYLALLDQDVMFFRLSDEANENIVRKGLELFRAYPGMADISGFLQKTLSHLLRPEEISAKLKGDIAAAIDTVPPTILESTKIASILEKMGLSDVEARRKEAFHQRAMDHLNTCVDKMIAGIKVAPLRGDGIALLKAFPSFYTEDEGCGLFNYAAELSDDEKAAIKRKLVKALVARWRLKKEDVGACGHFVALCANPLQSGRLEDVIKDPEVRGDFVTFINKHKEYLKGALSVKDVLYHFGFYSYLKPEEGEAAQFEFFQSMPTVVFSKGFKSQFFLKQLTASAPQDLARGCLFMCNREPNDVVISEYLQACYGSYVNRYEGSVKRATRHFFEDAKVLKLDISDFMDRDFLASIYGNEVERDDFDEDHKKYCADPDRVRAYMKGLVLIHGTSSGSSPEVLNKVEWLSFANTLLDSTRFKTLPVTKTAFLLAQLIRKLDVKNNWHKCVKKGSFEPLVDHLWTYRDQPDVKEVLKDPRLLNLLTHQSVIVRVARWQLEQIPGFQAIRMSVLQPERVLEALPQYGEVRTVIGAVYALLDKQFGASSPSSTEVLQFVQKSILPNAAEMKVFEKLKCYRKDDASMTAIDNLISTDIKFIQSRLGLSQKRADVLRYLLDLTDIPPEIKDVPIERMRQFKAYALQGGDTIRLVTIRAILGDDLKVFDPKTPTPLYETIRQIILEDANDNTALVFIFDQYMSLLHSDERRFLLSFALAGYDKGEGGFSAFKRLLAAAGPLGGKISQGLVTAGVVKGKLRQSLMSSFDDFLPPTLHQIHEDIKSIFGSRTPDILVGRLLGSGSLNYVVEIFIKTPQGYTRCALRVQKTNVRPQISNEMQLWDRLIGMCKVHDSDQIRTYGYLIGSVLEVASESLSEGGVELDLRKERENVGLARRAYFDWRADPDTGMSIDVPRPVKLYQGWVHRDWQSRSSVYQFIDQTPMSKIPDDRLRMAIARQSLRAELDALDKGLFDVDGHDSNWLPALKIRKLLRADTAMIEHVPQGLRLIKPLMRLLITDDRAGLLDYFTQRGDEIFEMPSQGIQNYESILRRILSSDAMPSLTDPIERILYIRNELERVLASQNIYVLPYQKGVTALLASLVRINMRRLNMTDDEFMKELIPIFFETEAA